MRLSGKPRAIAYMNVGVPISGMRSHIQDLTPFSGLFRKHVGCLRLCEHSIISHTNGFKSFPQKSVPKGPGTYVAPKFAALGYPDLPIGEPVMIEINWQRKATFFYCPACRKRVSDAEVTGDQVHDRSRGVCGEFVFSEAHAQ
jgi:hypothetical protein